MCTLQLQNQPVSCKGCVHISSLPNQLRAQKSNSLPTPRQCGAVRLRLTGFVYGFLLGKAHTNTPSEKLRKHFFFLHGLAWWSFPRAMLQKKKKSNLGVKKPRFQSLGNKLNLQSLCFTDKSVIKKKKRRNPVMPKVTDSLDPVPS